jgi:hypothetical protein
METMAARVWLGAKYETPESEVYVGLNRTTALDAARAAGIHAIRVFEIPGASRYTMGFSPRRLSLLVEEDTVVAAGFSDNAASLNAEGRPVRRLRAPKHR